eukprot:6457561-Heterocapsa_arctica.AAC.1
MQRPGQRRHAQDVQGLRHNWTSSMMGVTAWTCRWSDSTPPRLHARQASTRLAASAPPGSTSNSASTSSSSAG